MVVIVFLMLLDGKQRKVATMWITPFAKMVWPMFFGLITVIAFLKVNWIVDPQIRLPKFTFGTPLGRALLAQVFVAGPIFFGSGVLVWIVGWLTGYIPRNIERNRNA